MDNLLLSNGKVRTVLNWEHAAIGDPRLDAAQTSLSLQWKQDRSLANRFIARYVRLTDTSIEDLNFWEGLAALRFYALSKWLRTLNGQSFEAVAGKQTFLFDRESKYQEKALKQFA